MLIKVPVMLPEPYLCSLGMHRRHFLGPVTLVLSRKVTVV